MRIDCRPILVAACLIVRSPLLASGTSQTGTAPDASEKAPAQSKPEHADGQDQAHVPETKPSRRPVAGATIPSNLLEESRQAHPAQASTTQPRPSQSAIGSSPFGRIPHAGAPIRGDQAHSLAASLTPVLPPRIGNSQQHSFPAPLPSGAAGTSSLSGTGTKNSGLARLGGLAAPAVRSGGTLNGTNVKRVPR
jgi:hypothetical protein